jgi:hypothetical protein
VQGQTSRLAHIFDDWVKTSAIALTCRCQTRLDAGPAVEPGQIQRRSENKMVDNAIRTQALTRAAK